MNRLQVHEQFGVFVAGFNVWWRLALTAFDGSGHAYTCTWKSV
jgi:hypothetical protein